MNLIEEFIIGEAKKQTAQNVVDIFYPKNSYMNLWLTHWINVFARRHLHGARRQGCGRARYKGHLLGRDGRY